jgi:signal transduction histidine kinase
MMTQSMPGLQDNVMLARRRAVTVAVRSIAGNGSILLGLCAIAVLWVGVLHSLSAEREQALRGARQETSNLSRAFEEHIVRSIKAIDQTLLYVRDSYEKDRAKFDLTAWMGNTKFLTDMAFQIVLIDKNGLLVASNLTAAGTRMDLSDRKHFWIHRERAHDELFISKPVFGRASNKWSIQLTRRLSAADGTFDGVVVVSLDPQYLSRFYDSVDLGKQGVVTITGLDGIVRARAAAGDTSIGQSLTGSRLFEEYAHAKSGTFEAESQIDGIKRIFAYREVRGFPLVVSVGIAQDEVLAGYESGRRSYLVLAALLTAVLIAVIVLIARHQARLNRTRAALGASEARYAQKSALLEATLEHMSQGIMMVDADRRVQVCNRRAITRLQLPEALMAEHPHFDDVLRWQWQQGEFGTDGGDVETWLRNFVRSGGIAESPHTYERTRRDGTVLEIRSTPLPEGGVVRTYTDITLRKQTEAGLRVARDEADRAARAKSEFLAMMSHEIRSPMNGLLGIIELLRETPLADEQLGMVTMVHQSATSLLGILDDILDFSKIEAGAIGLTEEATPLREMLKTLVEPFVVGAARKGLALELAIADDVPDCIAVDPLRLRQILVNLISNALKFTAAGSVRIAVTCKPLPESDAPGLSFAVRDSGIGMSPAVLERLFQPFTQADASTTKNYGGTGLGLSISRRLAGLLGGAIVVTSEVGRGSTFTLSLPLVVAERTVAETAEAAGRLPDGIRILVAEDQKTNR